MDKLISKPIAFIMVGLPGSGKSTWSKTLLQSGQFDLISTDHFIDLEAQKQGKTYDDLHREYIKEADKICRSYLKEVIEAKRNLIWDQTNLSVKSRRSCVQQLKDYVRIAVVFKIDKETLQSRLNLRAEVEGKTISESILSRMCNYFQIPTLEEGFHQIIEVNYD
jgi:predicted kinase